MNRQGAVRAAVVDSGTALEVTEFVHNTDGGGSATGKVKPELVVTETDGVQLVANSGAFDGWMSIQWDHFAGPVPLTLEQVLRALNVENEGKGRVKATEVLAYLRKTYGGYVEGLVFLTKDPVVAAGVTLDRYPQLSELWVTGLQREIEYAIKVARYAYGEDAGKTAEERGLFLVEQMRAYLVSHPFAAESELQVYMARLIMGQRLDQVRLSNSVEEFGLDTSSHLVLSQFLGDPQARETYNQIVSEGGGRRALGEHELPFWVISVVNGQIVRQTLEIEGTTVRVGDRSVTLPHRPETTDQLFAALRQLNDETIAVTPKALLLVLEELQHGYMFYTHLGYLDQARALADALGIKLNPGVQVFFDQATAMDGHFPKELYPLWTGDTQRRQLKGLDEARRQGVKTLEAASLEYWAKRPTLVSTWLMGGDELIDRTLAEATMRIDDPRVNQIIREGEVDDVAVVVQRVQMETGARAVVRVAWKGDAITVAPLPGMTLRQRGETTYLDIDCSTAAGATQLRQLMDKGVVDVYGLCLVGRMGQN